MNFLKWKGASAHLQPHVAPPLTNLFSGAGHYTQVRREMIKHVNKFFEQSSMVSCDKHMNKTKETSVSFGWPNLISVTSLGFR